MPKANEENNVTPTAEADLKMNESEAAEITAAAENVAVETGSPLAVVEETAEAVTTETKSDEPKTVKRTRKTTAKKTESKTGKKTAAAKKETAKAAEPAEGTEAEPKVPKKRGRKPAVSAEAAAANVESAGASDTSTVKKTAGRKRAAAKTTAAGKTTAEKTTSGRKAKEAIFLQYAGREMDIAAIVERAKKSYEGKSIKEIKVYVKPEENMAYYVVNGNETGCVEL